VLSCCHSGLYNYELTPDKSLRGKKFWKEFSEWAQCLVLELVVKYVPLDSSEIFDIMNLLEDRLQHANGAVVLATIKVFLQLTLSMTDVHQQVRIKAFFIYSFSSNCQETV
jgi:vesicle coat complex subunit